MDVAASSRGSRSVLRAVIEEARRHARRRRIRALFIGLVCAAAGLVGYSALRPSHSSGIGTRVVRVNVASTAAPMRNGELTLMDLQGDCPPSPASGCGWYAISSVAGARRLRPLVRCPHRARWCGEVESIDWSRDGRRLAFGVTSYALVGFYNGLHVLDTATGRDRRIVKLGVRDEYDWADIDWSPGGRRLAYVSGGAISIVRADGSGHRIVSTGNLANPRSPSWSPDGKWLAFSARYRGRGGIYVSRPDGSQRRIVAAPGATPAWSPDGSRIAFAGGKGVLFVTPNGRLLAPRAPFRAGVPVGFNAAPVWSPDGTKIALRGLGQFRGTFVMNADGSNLRRVTSRSVSVPLVKPAWRPRR